MRAERTTHVCGYFGLRLKVWVRVRVRVRVRLKTRPADSNQGCWGRARACRAEAGISPFSNFCIWP